MSSPPTLIVFSTVLLLADADLITIALEPQTTALVDTFKQKLLGKNDNHAEAKNKYFPTNNNATVEAGTNKNVIGSGVNRIESMGKYYGTNDIVEKSKDNRRFGIPLEMPNLINWMRQTPNPQITKRAGAFTVDPTKRPKMKNFKKLFKEFVLMKQSEAMQRLTTAPEPSLGAHGAVAAFGAAGGDGSGGDLSEVKMESGERPRLVVPAADQLDMAPALGGRVHHMRVRGRLCQRSVLMPEGPKYDHLGREYLAAFKHIYGRDYRHTRAPRLLLPRCCNCCKKSVLGCE